MTASPATNMRVLFLCHEYPPLGGGAANATYYLTRELDKLGITVDLITSTSDEERIENIVGGG